MNLDKFFQQYEDVVQQVENTFEKVKNEYNDCVNCKVGCADCCHALFDLTLIEALYVKAKFDAIYQGEEKEVLLERANRADRAIHKLKRKAYKEYESGRSEREILEEMSEKRERCPLLNDDQRCDLYAYRPITCRLYGVPSQIGERAHCCPLSGFEPGRSYPSVKIDQIQKRLYQISAELAREIRSRYPELAQMLVPLSMALLTDYTEDYLGVRQEPSPDENQTSE